MYTFELRVVLGSRVGENMTQFSGIASLRTTAMSNVLTFAMEAIQNKIT